MSDKDTERIFEIGTPVKLTSCTQDDGYNIISRSSQDMRIIGFGEHFLNGHRRFPGQFRDTPGSKCDLMASNIVPDFGLV